MDTGNLKVKYKGTQFISITGQNLAGKHHFVRIILLRSSPERMGRLKGAALPVLSAITGTNVFKFLP
jgi:hypothetical protein